MDMTMNTEFQNAKSDKPKKSIIPYYFVAFFMVVFAVNGVLVYVASSSWTGLETKNHYLKGLSYNENLQGAKAMAELGWKSDLKLTEAGDGVLLSLSMQDKNDQSLDEAIVKMTAIRPTHHGYDQEILMIETQPGEYQGHVKLPLQGQWAFRMIVTRGENAYQHEERFIIDEKGIR